jgi:hypothetical protein
MEFEVPFGKWFFIAGRMQYRTDPYWVKKPQFSFKNRPTLA